MNEQSRRVYRERDGLVKSVEAKMTALHRGALAGSPDEVYEAVSGALAEIVDEVESRADSLADSLDQETKTANARLIESLKEAQNKLRHELGPDAIDDPAVDQAEDAIARALVEAGEVS